MVEAQGFSGLSLTFLLLFCGYIVPIDQTPSYWLWIVYSNPVSDCTNWRYYYYCYYYYYYCCYNYYY